MELIIVAAILLIVGYLIYYNLPSSQFVRANKLIKMKKYDKALVILKRIFVLHEEAVTKYAECYFIQAEECMASNPENALILFNHVLESKTHIKSKSNKDSFSEVEVKTIAKIAELQYLDGLRNERMGDFIKAIESYCSTISLFHKQEPIQLYFDSLCRKEICNLKLDDPINSEIFKQLISCSESIAIDFLYRYAIKLIKDGKYDKAEDILVNKLTKIIRNVNHEIKQLFDIIHNERVRISVLQLEEINTRIEKLLDHTFSVDETLSLYQDIIRATNTLIKYIPNIEVQLFEILPSLLNRLFKTFYENEQYEDALKLIIEFPKFHEYPEMLKNLCNVCINIVETGNVNEKNYQQITSVFLTCAYSDKVILRSLEDLTWDNEYSFTLVDSLGSNYKFHSDLPENVNFEEVNGSNVSIGEVQCEIVKQFEFLINTKISEKDLYHKVLKFYDREKQSLEKIIELIPTEMCFPTPHFANAYKLNKIVLDELEKVYKETKDEDALRVGEFYESGNFNLLISNYVKSKNTYNKILACFNSLNMQELKNLTIKENLNSIYEYESINNYFEDDLLSSFKKNITDNDENEELIPFMIEGIRILSNKERLKFLYVDYVADLCISKVNAKKITNYHALQLMLPAYLTLPTNPRTCKNIISLISMNVTDIITKKTRNTSDIFVLFDKIKSNISSVFRQYSVELREERAEILSNMPKDLVPLLTDDFQNAILYGSTQLTEDGKKLKKCLDYLAVFGGVALQNDPFSSLKRTLGLNI